MKGWIVVNILTHTEESEKLEDLDIPVDMDTLPYKKHLLQISTINTIALEKEKGCTIHIVGDYFIVKETAQEIIKLINDNNN